MPVLVKKNVVLHFIASITLTLGVLLPVTGRAEAGDVYEADFGSGKLYRLTPGNGRTEVASGIAGEFGLAFNQKLEVFAASEDAGTIYKIPPGGAKTVFASGLNHPIGLGFDVAGNLYEADLNSSSVQKFTPAGVKTTFASGIDRPLGLAVDRIGDVFVGGLSSNLITKISPNGTKTVFASGLATPGGLAFDPAGNLFVTERHGGTILKYSPTGAVTTFASGLNDPYGLVFDSAGNLYAAAHLANTVYEFSPAGIRTTFATGLNLPSFLAIEPATGSPVNISTRAQVQTGDNVLIGGFIITGSGPKKVMIRGIGPSLAAAGVPGALSDPTLELRNQAGTLVSMNDNWRDTQQAAIINTGIPPNDDRESAIVISLPSGRYTVIARGKGNTTGVGLVELYDLTSAAPAKLANISTRALVGTGSDVMIAGFILGAGNGAKVLIRGLGPSLRQSGITDPLANPMLELRDANGQLVLANDNWKSTQATAIQATTIPPTNDLESAIVTNLPNGRYTAILKGQNGGTGVGLIEVFNLR